MSYTREIDLYTAPGAEGALVRSLSAEATEAWFTLSSSGGCGAGEVAIPVTYDDLGAIGIQRGMEVRFRWSTSEPYVYAGVITTIRHNLEEMVLRLDLLGLGSWLDRLHATGAESAGQDRVDFGSLAVLGDTPHSDRDRVAHETRGIVQYYLEELIAPELGVVGDESRIDDDDLDVTRVEWNSTQSLLRVFDDLSHFAGAEGEIYRWGVIPGADAGDPHRLYFRSVSALTDVAAECKVRFDVRGLERAEGDARFDQLSLIGGVDDATVSGQRALFSETYTRAGASGSILRSVRLVQPAVINEEMGERYWLGFEARNGDPGVWFEGLRVIANEETQIPLPWEGHILLVDEQAGVQRREEFSSMRVDWVPANQAPWGPLLEITLGRNEAALISDTAGNVLSPTTALGLALTRFEDLSPAFLPGGGLTGSQGGGALPLGAILEARALASSVVPGGDVQWFIAIAHGGSLANIGNVTVEYAFLPDSGGGWSSVSEKTLAISDRITSDDWTEQRVGPASPLVINSPGVLAFRFLARSPGGTLLHAMPGTTDEDKWLKIDIADIGLSVSGDGVTLNVYEIGVG